MDSGHPWGSGWHLRIRTATWGGKDEEASVVRVIMIKKGWWMMFEGDPRCRRQGFPRPLPGPSLLHHLQGHWGLEPFNVSCPVYSNSGRKVSGTAIRGKPATSEDAVEPLEVLSLLSDNELASFSSHLLVS